MGWIATAKSVIFMFRFLRGLDFWSTILYNESILKYVISCKFVSNAYPVWF